jgi:hypothetical protein
MKALRSLLLPTILTAIFSASFLTPTAHAGTATGTVINRSTGKPVPNVELDLVAPTQGMKLLASIKSDAQGQFTATNDAIGAGPVLIRVTYQGVSYNTFLPPGRPTIEVEVFDVSKDPKTISAVNHVVIFQPRNDKLVGAEEYVVQNNSQPAVAYFRNEGNFDFLIPANATLQQVTTTSSAMGMDVPQASIEKGKGRFAIAYAFRPGETNVRLSYELPYPDAKATVTLPNAFPGMKLLVVVPIGVTLTGDGLVSSGQEQGMLVYSHEPLAAKATLKVTVSGVGAPQQSADGGAGADQGQGGMPQQGNSRTGGQDVQAVPGRLDALKWPIILGFAALFALGAVVLSRKQIVVAPSPEHDDDDPDDSIRMSDRGAAKKQAKLSTPPIVPTAPPSVPASTAAKVAAVNADVTVSLDALKDSIFRLELRRQAGTISEEDYARERAQMEKTLRDLVRG